MRKGYFDGGSDRRLVVDEQLGDNRSDRPERSELPSDRTRPCVASKVGGRVAQLLGLEARRQKGVQLSLRRGDDK